MKWDFVIWFTVVIAYCSISDELGKIKKKLNNEQKTKWNLKELLEKKVKVTLEDVYDMELEGILVSFDNQWIEIKEIKKYDNNVIYYKRIDKIKSIAIKNN